MAATLTTGRLVKEARLFQGVRLTSTTNEYLRLGADGIVAMEAGSQGIVVWLGNSDGLPVVTMLVPWPNIASARFNTTLPLPKE